MKYKHIKLIAIERENNVNLPTLQFVSDNVFLGRINKPNECDIGFFMKENRRVMMITVKQVKESNEKNKMYTQSGKVKQRVLE